MRGGRPPRGRGALHRRPVLLGGAGGLLVVAVLLLLLDVRPPRSGVIGFDPARLPHAPTPEAFRSFDAADGLTGFAGKDLRTMDLRGLPPSWLAAQTFDTRTRWPVRELLPEGFHPASWLATGRDPGLGVRHLQRRGIAGEGVVLAVIDKPILPDHREFAGRLIYHPGATSAGDAGRPHFHGIAVASFLAGTTAGVAPAAQLHYFAVPDDGRNTLHYGEALAVIAALNARLPRHERIRLVVISDNAAPSDRGWRTWQSGLAAAQATGVEVVTSTVLERAGFAWGGAAPGRNRDDPDAYRVALRLRDQPLPTSVVLVPGDFRTRASNAGSDAYAYSGTGGMSWAIPYVGGLVALGLRVDPRLELKRALDLLRESAADNGLGRKVVDPVAYLGRVASAATR